MEKNQKKLPSHVAIIMDGFYSKSLILRILPISARGGQAAVLHAGCFGGRDTDFGRYG